MIFIWSTEAGGMGMKRFLILSILIVFVAVSYAGPNKVGWTGPDFHQDRFEKDRKECMDSIDTNLNSEGFGKALEECLDTKGYKYQASQDKNPSHEDKDPPSVWAIIGAILFLPLFLTFPNLGGGLNKNNNQP